MYDVNFVDIVKLHKLCITNRRLVIKLTESYDGDDR